jgi:hypothetical protein
MWGLTFVLLCRHNKRCVNRSNWIGIPIGHHWLILVVPLKVTVLFDDMLLFFNLQLNKLWIDDNSEVYNMWICMYEKKVMKMHFKVYFWNNQQISEVMTRDMDVPAATAKKITDTFLRRFRRCPENVREPLDEWRENLWIQALGDDFEELAGGFIF